MKSLRPGADARPVWPPPKRSSIWLATTRPAGCRGYDSIESNTATSVNPRFQDSSVFQKPEAHGRYQAERAQRRAGSQPARRARQRKPFCSVGVADGGRQDACPTLRFIESLLSLMRMHWDLEPAPNPSREGSSTGWLVHILGGVRSGFVAHTFMARDRAVRAGPGDRTSAYCDCLQPVGLVISVATPPDISPQTIAASGKISDRTPA